MKTSLKNNSMVDIKWGNNFIPANSYCLVEDDEVRPLLKTYPFLTIEDEPVKVVVKPKIVKPVKSKKKKSTRNKK